MITFISNIFVALLIGLIHKLNKRSGYNILQYNINFIEQYKPIQQIYKIIKKRQYAILSGRSDLFLITVYAFFLICVHIWTNLFIPYLYKFMNSLQNNLKINKRSKLFELNIKAFEPQWCQGRGRLFFTIGIERASTTLNRSYNYNAYFFIIISIFLIN